MAQWIEGITAQVLGYTGGTHIDVPPRLVLHTTEGRSWPPYGNGKTAPHFTIQALPMLKALSIRQHIPIDVAARALANSSGGVETNRANCTQIELLGTCDPSFHSKYPDSFAWYDPDVWALAALGSFLVRLSKLRGFKLSGPPRPFLSYPSSYGSRSGQRMDYVEWYSFNGICGHQHVPENLHGDPGSFPFNKMLELIGNPATITTPTVPETTLPEDDAMFVYIKGDAMAPIYLWDVGAGTRRYVTGEEYEIVHRKAKSGDKRFDVVIIPQVAFDKLPKVPTS